MKGRDEETSVNYDIFLTSLVMYFMTQYTTNSAPTLQLCTALMNWHTVSEHWVITAPGYH